MCTGVLRRRARGGGPRAGVRVGSMVPSNFDDDATAAQVSVCGAQVHEGDVKCLCCVLAVSLLSAVVWFEDEANFDPPGLCPQQEPDDTLFLFFDAQCGAAKDTCAAYILSPLSPTVFLTENLHGQTEGGCWNWANSCSSEQADPEDPLALSGLEWGSWDRQCTRAPGTRYHPIITAYSSSANSSSGRGDIMISGLCDTRKGQQMVNSRWSYQGVTADGRPWYKSTTADDAADLEAARKDVGKCSCLPPTSAPAPLSAEHPLLSGDSTCPTGYTLPDSPQACAQAAASAGFPARFGVQTQCVGGNPCDPDVSTGPLIRFADGARVEAAQLPLCFIVESECNRLMFVREGSSQPPQDTNNNILSVCVPDGWSAEVPTSPPTPPVSDTAVLWRPKVQRGTFIECEASCAQLHEGHQRGALACGRSSSALYQIIGLVNPDRETNMDVWVANLCEGADQVDLMTTRAWASNQDGQIYPASRERSLECVCEDFATNRGLCDWNQATEPSFDNLRSCREQLGEEYVARGDSRYRTVSTIKCILSVGLIMWAAVLLVKMILHRRPKVKHPVTRAQLCLSSIIISLTMDVIDFARAASGSTFGIDIDLGSIDSYGDVFMFVAIVLFGWLWTDLMELVRRQNSREFNHDWRIEWAGGHSNEQRVDYRRGLGLVLVFYVLTAVLCIPTAAWFASEGGLSPGADVTGFKEDARVDGGEVYNVVGIFAGWLLLTPAAVRMERSSKSIVDQLQQDDASSSSLEGQKLAVRVHWVAKVNLIEQLAWNVFVSICYVYFQSLSMDDISGWVWGDVMVFGIFCLQHGQLCFFFSTIGAPELVQKSARETTAVEDGALLQSLLQSTR